MKSLLKSKKVLITIAITVGLTSLPTTASATGSVNVTASQTSVAPNESVQFTVDAGNGERLGALFTESGTGWSLFDRGFVKDLPLLPWSTFSPPCDTNLTVIYRVYTTLMVDYDPENPPQYGDFTTAGLVAGDSSPVQFFGSKCNDGIALVISNDSTTLAAVAGTLAVENIGANKSVTWSITGGANAGFFDISSTGLISFKTSPAVGTYTVIVTATDTSGNTVSETFTVVVSPAPVVAPPAPGITIAGPFSITSTPGQLNVGNYTASSDVKWAITSGKDAVLFEISTTGTLSFKSEPEPGTYTAVITASDAAGNVTSKSVTITVPIKSAPIISGGSLTPTVVSGERTVARFTADRFVRWSITGGKNASLFRIGAAGSLSFNSAETPGVYLVVITATDSAGNATSQLVTITVSDQTETVNAPALPAEKMQKAAKIFSGFALGKSTVSPSMRKSIQTFIRANPNYTSIAITGYTQGPTVLWSDNALARARANSIAAVIKRLNPKARISIAAKTELAVGSNIRRARVVLTFK